MKNKKVRLDLLLVERGLIETREKAKRTIMAGLVFTETQRLDKPGLKVEEDIPLEVKGKVLPYVGRGGLKLEKALKVFNLDIKQSIMIDIGSSTGGFTDCALQNGVKRCYAIDVGYNQLDWKLRNDERVIVMERTNFRHVNKDRFQAGIPDFASIDVSFISLRLIFPVLKEIIASNGQIIALIKPQFEAGKEQVGKKGIVREKTTHIQVIKKIFDFCIDEGFNINGLTYSPITGGDGNIEFLTYLTLPKVSNNQTTQQLEDLIKEVVEEAHHVHNNK